MNARSIDQSNEVPNQRSCLYLGEVGHRRGSPVSHHFSYRVYNLFVDLDDLPGLSKRLRFFSYNRFNLFSVSDRDHGSGDGTSIRDHVWSLVEKSSAAAQVTRICMFCYPGVLGYVFNPLTVYFGFDKAGTVVLAVYEVNNTFGQRHSYVMPIDVQHCAKQLYVSPFNPVDGSYRFRIETPAERIKLTIALVKDRQPCFKAWFHGTRTPLSDATLLRSFFSLPLQPLKVMAGIHFEAARLWLKGLRISPRPNPPGEPASFSTGVSK
jgi:uncharacterized protein